MKQEYCYISWLTRSVILPPSWGVASLYLHCTNHEMPRRKGDRRPGQASEGRERQTAAHGVACVAEEEEDAKRTDALALKNRSQFEMLHVNSMNRAGEDMGR